MRTREKLVVAMLLAATACVGGGEAVQSTGSSPGRGGPVIDEPGPPSGPTEASMPTPVPVVACGQDAGTDAADAADASSPCSVPPRPYCQDPVTMAVLDPGTCSSGRCAFEITMVPCRGGCFRTLEGAVACNSGP